jgi:hypothetical protein
VEGQARVVRDDGLVVGERPRLAHEVLVAELRGVREEPAVVLDELLQAGEGRALLQLLQPALPDDGVDVSLFEAEASPVGKRSLRKTTYSARFENSASMVSTRSCAVAKRKTRPRPLSLTVSASPWISRRRSPSNPPDFPRR